MPNYKRTKTKTLVLLISPTLIILFSVIIMMRVKISTLIESTFQVTQVIFKLHSHDNDLPDAEQLVLKTLQFNSVAIGKFQDIKFTPKSFEVADPQYYHDEKYIYPELAWIPLKFATPLLIIGSERRLLPAVTLQSTDSTLEEAWKLDDLYIQPGAKVLLRMNNYNNSDNLFLTIEVQGKSAGATISFSKNFYLTCNQATISGIERPPLTDDYLTYRGILRKDRTQFTINSYPEELLLNLSLQSKNISFSNSIIYVSELDFTRLNPKGELEVTTLRDSHTKISYPNYREIDTLNISGTDVIRFDSKDMYQITYIGIDLPNNCLRLTVRGISSKIEVGNSRDLRLTLFDKLQGSQISLIISILAWSIASSIGAYRLYKEIKHDR